MQMNPFPSVPAKGRSINKILAIALVPLVLTLLLFIPVLPSQTHSHEDSETTDIFDQVNSMLKDLREIMGFGPSLSIQHSLISQNEFRNLYRKQLQEEFNPKQIRAEVLFLKLFGLVTDDFDYETTLLDLMSEQVWALYHYKTHHLYIADWAPPDARSFALVHELTHAVDDQQFNLHKYIKSPRNSETQLARIAAVEGQASWVMTEWVMRQSDRSLLDNRLLAITTASATRFEAEQFPVFESSPLYLQETLIFPYTDGLLFQQAMIERYGQEGFRRVFENPPQSTLHILQPELYVDGLTLDHLDLPEVRIPKGYKKVYEGVFGQLDHRILLEHHLGDTESDDLLNKWRGARFEAYENRKDGHSFLRYAVRWADEDAASEYYNLYREICKRKWEGLELIDQGGNQCQGIASVGEVTLRRKGNIVESLEGLPQGTRKDKVR